MPRPLEDVQLRPLPAAESGIGLRPLGLALGAGPNPLEIVVFEADSRPSSVILRETWKRRWGGRASPVVVVATWAGGTAICGPSEADPPPLYSDVPAAVADTILRAALAEPDRHAVWRLFSERLHDLEQRVFGLRNEGLFATHHLQIGARGRPDWDDAKARALSVRSRRSEELLAALGFGVERGPGQSLVLRHQQSKVALAVLVDRGTDVDAAHPDFNGSSPVSYGLAKADEESLRWLVVLEGSRLRLYATDPAAGVGRRGRTETFVQVDLDLLGEVDAAYLWLLFGAEALARGGSVEQLLAESRDYAVSLATRLRERIYTKVMPTPPCRGRRGAQRVRPQCYLGARRVS